MMGKFKRNAIGVVMVVLLGYLVLLIPERDPAGSSIGQIESQKQPFAWNQDAYWESLEARYRELRKTGREKMAPATQSAIEKLNDSLKSIEGKKLNPEAKVFDELEQRMFEAGSLVGGCRSHLPEYRSDRFPGHAGR
jgi:hypothetical protein